MTTAEGRVAEVGTTPASKGDASNHRRPDIQSLRAIAVLAVVAYHAQLPVPGGYLGVDVFFVISGFVITAGLRREWGLTEQIDFRRFYLRRFKRLTPALALTVTVTLVLSALLLSPFGSQQTAALTGAGAILLIANFVISACTGGYFDAPAESNPLLNTWSLSVEEQFYLVFPALIALGWVIARGHGRVLRRVPILLVTAIAAISLGLAIAASSFGITTRFDLVIRSFYSPVDRAWEFAAGALLALTHANRSEPSSRRCAVAGGAGIALLAASFFFITGDAPVPGWPSALPVCGTLLLLWAGTSANGPVSRALSAPVLVRVGDWSYSIYLWHWPFIVFALYLWPTTRFIALAAAIASLLPALASYRWVETRIRGLTLSGGRKTALLVAAVTLPPLVLAVTVDQSASRFWQPRYADGSLALVTGDLGPDPFWAEVSKSSYPCAPIDVPVRPEYYKGIPRCRQSRADGPVTMAIIGDSHAEVLFPGFATALPHINVGYYIRSSQLPTAEASREMSQIVNYVASNPNIRTVVLNAFWSFYSSEDIARVETTIRQMEQAGKEVLVLDDVPTYAFQPVQCSRIAPSVPVARCSKLRSDEDVLYDRYREVLRRAVDAVPGANLVSTHRYFCDNAECSMVVAGRIVYQDKDHVNVTGSKYLVARMLADNPDLTVTDRRGAAISP